jgi:phage terminase large subunit-like protein
VGDVKLVSAAWNSVLLDELEVFPQGQHGDQVDVLSAAIAMQVTRPQITIAPGALDNANRGFVRPSP